MFRYADRADAWTAALVLMALVQVIARLVVIRVKAYQAGQSKASSAAAAGWLRASARR